MPKPAAAPRTPSATAKEFVPDWQVVVGLKRTRLDEIAAEMLSASKLKKDAEARIKELQAEGAKLLIKADVKSVLVNGARVTRIDGVSSKLNKQKLTQAHGMKVLDWLEEATDRTPWTSLKVTPPGEEE